MTRPASGPSGGYNPYLGLLGRPKSSQSSNELKDLGKAGSLQGFSGLTGSNSSNNKMKKSTSSKALASSSPEPLGGGRAVKKAFGDFTGATIYSMSSSMGASTLTGFRPPSGGLSTGLSTSTSKSQVATTPRSGRSILSTSGASRATTTTSSTLTADPPSTPTTGSTGGTGSGSAALSLRDKLHSLQKHNKALEQKLQDADSAAETAARRSAAEAEALRRQVAELQQLLKQQQHQAQPQRPLSPSSPASRRLSSGGSVPFAIPAPNTPPPLVGLGASTGRLSSSSGGATPDTAWPLHHHQHHVAGQTGSVHIHTTTGLVLTPRTPSTGGSVPAPASPAPAPAPPKSGASAAASPAASQPTTPPPTVPQLKNLPSPGSGVKPSPGKEASGASAAPSCPDSSSEPPSPSSSHSSSSCTDLSSAASTAEAALVSALVGLPSSGSLAGATSSTPSSPVSSASAPTSAASSKAAATAAGAKAASAPVLVSVGVQADLGLPPQPQPPTERATSAGRPNSMHRSGATPSGGALAAAAAAAAEATAEQIAKLQAELRQAKSVVAFLQGELSEAEAAQKDADAARRDYAARFAFVVLDTDHDGYIRTDQVQAFDVFAPYAGPTLDAVWRHWRFTSGYTGFLTIEDFLKLVTWAEDRATRESQRFWFSVLDADGDGRIGPEDAKLAYDAVSATRPAGDTSFMVPFDNLWSQLLDMVKPAGVGLEPGSVAGMGPGTGPVSRLGGFSAMDLWASKLGSGVLGLLLNHNNMLLQRTTAEWGRGDWPL